MKARVYYSEPWWYGEVYADWVFGGECWRDVTDNCFTKLGATIALKSWLRKNKTYDIE
jgi:hypothetical protein